jgi:hypothetical protein
MIYKEIYKWSVFLTGLVSFLVWHVIRFIYIPDVKEYLQIDDNLLIIIKFVIGAFFSFGFFIGMVSLFGGIIEKFKFIKKLFFGSSYIEGVWLGFGSAKNDEIVFLVLHIEQTSYGVSANGETFKYNDGNLILRGSWASTSATFDNVTHTLIVTYGSNKTNEVNEGFSINNFFNQGKKPPKEFLGYNTNFTISGKRTFIGKRFYDLEKRPDLKVITNDMMSFYEEKKEKLGHTKVTAARAVPGTEIV